MSYTKTIKKNKHTNGGTEMKQADQKLHDKGYYLFNMAYNKNQYELCDGEGEVLIDHLSEAQVIALSEML